MMTFEEWEAGRLQDPEFLAALEAQYPKYERDRAQVQITILQEENSSLRAECDKLDKQAAMAIALADEAQALSAKVLDENDALRTALRAAPKPPWNFRPTIGWQGVYCDWYEAQLALVKGYNDT